MNGRDLLDGAAEYNGGRGMHGAHATPFQGTRSVGPSR